MSNTVPLNDAWNGQADCERCSIRGSVLFAGLGRSDFERIHEPIVQRRLTPGETLYHAGEAGRHLFTLRRGRLKLVHYLPDGTQRIVRLIRATDVTGLEALLDQPYAHAAIAMQDSELCCLPVHTVRRLAEDNPALHRELLARWQRALDEADRWLAELSTGPARRRVARLIERLIEGDPPRCRLFPREDLGAMLGITTETASRTVAEFRRRGVLAEAGPNLYDVNRALLERELD